MQHSIFLIFLCGLLLLSCGSDSSHPETDNLFDITLTNYSSDTLKQYGIDIDLFRVDGDFHLKNGGKEIPVQIEDRNSNGSPDKMFAQVDLIPGSIMKFIAVSGKGPEVPEGVRLHAHLSDGTAIQGSHLVNFEEKWAANGIVMENEWIGFRSLMTPPYALDIIGKRKPEMLTGPISMDLSKITEWGGDALDEALSLGIGSPAIFDLEKIVPLSRYDSKEINIIQSGPLRAEVDMTIRGIPVRDEKIDVLVKWQMQSGKHWSQIDFSILSKTDLTLQFAFGLPRHEEATDFTQGLINEVHFAYTYGLQSSEGEPLGMAILVPGKYEIDTYRDDPHNYFYLVEPIERSVQYRILGAWVKGRLAIFDEIEFLNLVRKYTAEYGAKVTIEPHFRLPD